MTVTPDPADLSAPRDPARYGRRRRRGPGAWVFAAFGVLCVLAGAAIASFAPTLLPPRPPQGALSDTAFPSGEASAPMPTPTPAPTALVAPQPLVAPAGARDLADLSDRLEALEAENAKVTQAAASALAAAALMEAAQTSRPFVEELAALRAVSPPSAELGALRPMAETGAPTRAALAASFSDYAARAASASRAPGDDAGLLTRLGYALSRVVTLRRVGNVAGGGVDAVLARAERQVEDGELNAALKTLDTLPPAGRQALSDWRARAERRAEIDRRIAGVRAQALEDLTDLSRPRS